MNRKTGIQTFTEKDSFSSSKINDFYISKYKDNEDEHLKRTSAHKHTYFEIIWVKNGKGTHTIDFEEYHFRGPCLFLLHPKNIHFINKKNKTNGGVIKFTNSFFFNDDYERNFNLKYGVFDDIDKLPVINITKEESKIFDQLFNQMKNESELNSPFSSLTILSFLKIFLLKVYEIKKKKIEINNHNDPFFLKYRKFLILLEANFLQEKNVLFYAEKIGISGRTLSNISHKFSGKSSKDLIKERIILEAKRLLYFSDLSIKETSYKLGFKDTAYFIRFFTKNTSVTPTQFRKGIS